MFLCSIPLESWKPCCRTILPGELGRTLFSAILVRKKKENRREREREREIEREREM